MDYDAPVLILTVEKKFTGCCYVIIDKNYTVNYLFFHGAVNQ